MFKLKLEVDHGNGRKITHDMGGLWIFLLSVFFLPATLLTYGVGMASMLVGLVGSTGIIHFCVMVFVRIWPYVREDMREAEARKNGED